jgi:hypothetical protein
MKLVQDEPMGRLFVCDQGHAREKHWSELPDNGHGLHQYA